MTTGIIEINDSQLRLTIGEQQWLSSGFATITGQDVLFGEKSAQQARLKPLNSYDQYWNQLSLDPVSTSHDRFRHYGDFAYQQLLDLVNQAGKCDKVILSVPASFDREQLSLLLGICQQCPFEVIGLVDSAVIAIADIVGPGHHVYLDIQLHQCLLTEINVDKQLQVSSVDIVTGTGLINLYQHWAKYLATQFIQQCRFDPLHEAATEQQLYDSLGQLLSSNENDIQLSINGNQVKLTRQSLTRHTQGLFIPVIKAFGHLGHIDSILLSERVKAIPELYNQLSNAITVEQNAVAVNCLKHQQEICGQSSALSFVTRLSATHSKSTKPQSGAGNASHVLLQNAAYPIGNKTIYVSTRQTLRLGTESSADACFSLNKRTDGLTLVALNGASALINGKPAGQQETLNCGDIVSFANNGDSLTLINVLKDENW